MITFEECLQLPADSESVVFRFQSKNLNVVVYKSTIVHIVLNGA
jgi:hypothetical protein